MKKHFFQTVLFFAFFPFVGFVAAGQTKEASIVVYSDSSFGSVNRRIFGNNILGYQYRSLPYASSDYADRAAGIWDPEQGKTVPEMLQLEKLAGITMLRYPGGPDVHVYNWKAMIGPVAKRPQQKFGLPEYLQHCSDLGAMPVISVPEYNYSAQDAADLVEYLNAPDDGKHPWAHKRLLDGHPSSWNVTWFEYGNETNRGDGKGKKMTAEEYAANYLAYQKAMKEVDSRILLGAVVSTDFADIEVWTPRVLTNIGPKLDFAVDHCYIPKYNRNDGEPSASLLFQIALSSDAQIERHYRDLNNLIEQKTLKRGVPIAVTEYNGEFIQDKKVPYRYTLGNALLNAEMLKVFMMPENNIAFANSWQFANEYWGAVRGYTYKGEAIVKRPLFYVFEMYREYFGDQLIRAEVQSPTYETTGGYTVEPAMGQGSEKQLSSRYATISNKWEVMQGNGFATKDLNDTIVVQFNGAIDANYYHTKQTFPAKPLTGYRVSAWVQTAGLANANGACIQVGDGRGWEKTRSVSLSTDVRGNTPWTKISTEYVTLQDTREIEILVRRLSGGGAVRGEMRFANFEIQEFIPQTMAAVPYLSVNASRTVYSDDASGQKKKRLYLMVVNKDLFSSIRTQILVKGMSPQDYTIWILNGPAIDATNEENPSTVSIQEGKKTNIQGNLILQFAPHSMTAIEIE